MLEVKRKPAGETEGASAPRTNPLNQRPGDQSQSSSSQPRQASQVSTGELFQAKAPILTGEIQFKGTVSVDGMLFGQVGPNSGLTVKQRSSASFVSQPELAGEIRFKEMLRVNGHIAGTVYSQSGTLIVDSGAIVEANVDVAVAVIGGVVRGDIIARERVELGQASKIHGNIWTRSIVIKDGAIFEGVCRMIEEAQKAR